MSGSLNLIFMGTPQFALPTLEALLASGHHICGVYTQPPRPAGRGQKERLSPVHEFALSKNLPVFTPASLRDVEAQQQFAELNADAAIVAAYGLLLPKQILGGTRLGCINVHPSLLPRWRGAAPIQRPIMAGDKETGVVIMQMDAGLDTGNMLLVKRYPIAEGTTAGQLHDALAHLAGPMTVETLDGLMNNTITPTPQGEDGVMYAHKISKQECQIVWSETVQSIRQKILGLSPHPGAYFLYNGEAIKILNAEADFVRPAASPGTVLNNQLSIECADGVLRPTLIQRPGKKVMPAVDVLKGFAIPPGTVLE